MRFLVFFLLLLLSVHLPGQQCTGNLGENIFTDGDFGSGPANILLPDPRIAPGFIYQSAPPPNDGFYTITNDMGAWLFRYDTWLPLGDNSSDPQGYMMVVNASFEPGLFYEQEVSGLCENTLYQFTADVINVIRRGSSNLLPNVSFLLDGQEYVTTGFIPEDEQWKSYGFTFKTAPGQSTVTLALRNNAPGGIGNDLALDNISFRACGPEALILPLAAADICEDGEPITLTATINGDQFPTPAVQWQRSPDGGASWADLPGETGRTFVHDERSPGRYYYRYLLANSPANLGSTKCRIVSNEKIVNVVPKRYTVVDTLCAGLTFTVGPKAYGASGTYRDTLTSSLGCDSILTLDLTIVDDPGVTGDFALTDPSCSYLTDGSVLLSGVAGGVGPYRFTFAGEPAQTGNPLVSLGEGDYPYRIEDRYGCAEQDTLRLLSPYPFSVDLGDDRDIVLGEPVQLDIGSTQPVDRYAWTPEGLVDCDSFCPVVRILPPHTLTLGLTAVSDDGCTASDSVRITVRADRLVYLPNAISPNGDGTNDFFTVYGSVPNVVSVPSLRIYDRWGAEVFAATDLPPNEEVAGWDGTRGGRPVPTGTYVYVAEVAFLDGEVLRYAGTLSVVK